MRPRPATTALLWACLAAAAPPLCAGDADGLYYEVDGGRVVITNNPSGAAARPLPGWGGREAPRASSFSAALSAASRWDPYFEIAARDAGISPLLLKAVARVESGFDPLARSPKGALGLMQLMPETARALGVTDPFDAWQNLQGGARHLRDLLDTFGEVDLALAAYNAGAGAVQRHGGIPAYPETLDYVRKVRGLLGAAHAASAREGRGGATAATQRTSDVRVDRRADGSFVISN